MSHFSVALNATLDRLKETAGISRVDFANRVGIPRSTLSAYATEKFAPDAAALEKLTAGLEEDGAQQIVKAHVLDNIPERWAKKFHFSDEPRKQAPLEASDLPPKFVRHMELILGEARSNAHVIAFVEDFVALLGLEKATSSPLPVSFPEHPIPGGPVFSANPSSGSTASRAAKPTGGVKKPGKK